MNFMTYSKQVFGMSVVLLRGSLAHVLLRPLCEDTSHADALISGSLQQDETPLSLLTNGNGLNCTSMGPIVPVSVPLDLQWVV